MSFVAATTNEYIERRYLFAIIAVGLSIRLYVCFFAGLPVFNTDTTDYFNMADAISRGAPYSYFSNGYPLIVAGTKLLFGEQQYLSALLTLNAVLSTLVLLFAFQISRRIFGASLALWTVAILAVWPNQLNYVRQFLSEVPSTFFLLLGIYLLTRGNHISSGVSLYLAAMVRSTLLPIGIALILWIFWNRKSVQAFYLLVGLIGAFAVDVLLQNFDVIRAPSNFGSNLLIAIKSTSTAGVQFTVDGFTQAQQSSPVSTYLAFAIQHPLEFATQRLSSLWELWGPWPEQGDVSSPRGTISRVLIGIRFPALLLAIYGFWANRNKFEVGIVALPIVILSIVHFFFFSTPRFTYPVEPLLLVLAMAGAEKIWLRAGPTSRVWHGS